jgi:hypothetical protein
MVWTGLRGVIFSWRINYYAHIWLLPRKITTLDIELGSATIPNQSGLHSIYINRVW